MDHVDECIFTKSEARNIKDHTEKLQRIRPRQNSGDRIINDWNKPKCN